VATIPTLPVEVPGNFNTSALFNLVASAINYTLAPVRFKAYSSTSQSIPSGTAVIPLTLDTEVVDSDGGHSTTTNTSRYVCQTAGLYWVSGSVNFATNSSNTRTLQILYNSGGVVGSAQQVAPAPNRGGSVFTSTLLQLNVGDYVEIAAWQDSGTSLATSASPTANQTTMCAIRLSA